MIYINIEAYKLNVRKNDTYKHYGGQKKTKYHRYLQLTGLNLQRKEVTKVLTTSSPGQEEPSNMMINKMTIEKQLQRFAPIEHGFQ